MLKVRFNCICTNDCYGFAAKRGMICGGEIHIDEYGCTTFIVNIPGSGPRKLVQAWFANYFKIID
jgi:hypothetical protein